MKLSTTSSPVSAMTLATFIWLVFGVVALLVGKPILNMWWHVIPFLYVVHVSIMGTLFTVILTHIGGEMIEEVVGKVVEQKLQEIFLAAEDDIEMVNSFVDASEMEDLH
ncbi:MAG: hypothetical protein RIA09_16275 [Hoeflea sp.]|jgi:hypothetical protein|uniref:hypothetical protein n=1 Tax=Hoeflea sp. TaxID=1940281 RepID=UPI0032ED6AF5